MFLTLVQSALVRNTHSPHDACCSRCFSSSRSLSSSSKDILSSRFTHFAHDPTQCLLFTLFLTMYSLCTRCHTMLAVHVVSAFLRKTHSPHDVLTLFQNFFEYIFSTRCHTMLVVHVVSVLHVVSALLRKTHSLHDVLTLFQNFFKYISTRCHTMLVVHVVSVLHVF